jgi:uncharacterized protein involved in type VI secretion and phage assembly
MNPRIQLFDIPTPGLFHGAHLAEVVNLDDPEGLARVQVRVLSVDGVADHDAPLWARVAVPFAGNNRGTFFIPDVGDEVLVVFVNGDPRHPIVAGGLWNGSDTAPESISGGGNIRKVIRSKNGVKLTLEDQVGQEKFIAETPGGQKVTLNDAPDGIAITVEDSNGNSVKLDRTGITVTASAKVTINASQVAISAGMVTVDAGMSRFSGVVQADTVISNTVISATYTPGAGNIW